MSLTNRLSIFFLASLAAVLAGFSLSLWFLASVHLGSQLDDRTASTMKTLQAAVETHPNDVQWEPSERRLVVGEDDSADQPRWILQDLAGQIKDRSLNLSETATPPSLRASGWHVLSRTIRPGVSQSNSHSDEPEAAYFRALDLSPMKAAWMSKLPEDRTFTADGVIITVAVSDAPKSSLLRWLGFAIVSVSLAIFFSAALVGRALCKRMLRPISEMAQSARAIRSEPTLTQPLRVPSTQDELEDLGLAFNDLLGRVGESLERQKRFAGDASHQLRTPLTALLGSVEVALRQNRDTEEYKRVLEVVVRRGGQLRQIIESLLFLARSNESAFPGSPEPLDLNRWCGSWLENWADHARASDIRFVPSGSPAIAVVHAALLGQMIDNLLDNATKYSEPGRPIVVAVERQGSFAAISVSDEGIGIDSSHLSRIFEPFFRTPETNWKGKSGVGLGLAVVQKLAAILPGRITVESQVGKGSTFTIHVETAASSPNGEFGQTGDHESSANQSS